MYKISYREFCSTAGAAMICIALGLEGWHIDYDNRLVVFEQSLDRRAFFDRLTGRA